MASPPPTPIPNLSEDGESSGAAAAAAVDLEDETTWDTDPLVASLIQLAGDQLDPLFREDSTACKRFLRARRGDPAEAAKMYLRHQQWRKEETPWWPASNAPLEKIKADLELGKGYVHGVDRQGRPCSWVRTKLHDANEDRESIHAFVCFTIDEGVARCERAIAALKAKGASAAEIAAAGTFAIVIDFDGFGYSNFDTETVSV